MNLNRRAILQGFGAAGLALVSPAWAQTSAAKPLFLIFDDLSADTPPDALRSVFAPFLKLGIPAGFIIAARSDADDIRGTQNGVAAVLRKIMTDSPDLAEAIVRLPDLAALPPYFQARTAGAAKLALLEFLGPDLGPVRDAGPTLLSIATRDVAGAPDLSGVRAAGFRNVLMLSAEPDGSRSALCGAMPCIRGALRHAITDSAYAMVSALNAALDTAEMVTLVLSLARVGEVAPEDLAVRASVLAEEIRAATQAGALFSALPRHHAAWFSTGPKPVIGLRIAAPAAAYASLRRSFDAFQRDLRSAGVGFSIAGPAGGLTGILPDCVVAGPGFSDNPKLAGLRAGAASCAIIRRADSADLAALAEAGLEIVIDPTGSAAGLDAMGLLRLRDDLVLTGPPDAGALTRFDAGRDLVISVAPGAYATAADRAAVLALLRQSGAPAPRAVKSISGFAIAILPVDPVYRRMLATRRSPRARTSPDAAPAGRARALLLQDAAIAWSYVDKMTEAATGLCPSTVLFAGANSSVYRYLTMWDFGSLVQATLAAHELGLIGDDAFRERATAILEGLPTQTIDGLALPSARIATNRKASIVADFNACDTGRLLVALAELDRHPLTRGTVAPRVAEWQFSEVVAEGHMHSITAGVRQEMLLLRSHCAHYAARAFGLWGITINSPYYVMRVSGSPTDTRMRLLYEVARIGALGAEPLLLEAVELGASPPTAYLADVLHAAQVQSHAETGVLIAASEGPMDRAPWFSYQGLKVDAQVDPWDVRAIDPAAKFQTESFRRGARSVSSKAAFLWAATRPGPYADLLVALVRRVARECEAGYAAGIYTESGLPMANYSDINTNGVILQSVAYILRGYRPRAGMGG
jgi:Protein of unknown function (DUF3131)